MSLILALGLLGTAVCRNYSAAVRHSIVSATLLFASILPLLTNFLPHWNVIPARTVQVAPPAIASTDVPLPARSPLPAAESNKRWRLEDWLKLCWVCGALITFGMTLAGLYRVRTIAAMSTPVYESRWSDLSRQIQNEYGIRRPIRLIQSRNPAILVTWGGWRPEVLLPAGAEAWPRNRIRAALYHEYAHIQRNDWAVQTASEVVKALYWFNPLFWIACRRLRLESEHCCDDRVLVRGMPATEYAGHLLDIIESLQNADAAWSAALPMARVPTVERRFKAMLNPHMDRHSLSGWTLAVILAVATVIVLPVATLRSAPLLIEAPPTLAVSAAVPSYLPASAGSAAPMKPPLSRPAQSGAAQTALPSSEEQTGTKPINLYVDNADIRDVFELMARVGSFSLVIDPGVDGTVTFHGEHVPWSEVMDGLMRSLNLEYTIYRTNDGRVLRIGRPQPQIFRASSGYSIPFLRQLSSSAADTAASLSNFGTQDPVILSDTHGYDLKWYLDQLANVVRLNWYPKIPEISKTTKGRVVLNVTVLKDGSFEAVRILSGSGIPDLDVAATQAVVTRYPALPADFPDDHINVQLTFLYNIP
jgi:TonB family protein